MQSVTRVRTRVSQCTLRRLSVGALLEMRHQSKRSLQSNSVVSHAVNTNFVNIIYTDNSVE